jgi:hypothetical protein
LGGWIAVNFQRNDANHVRTRPMHLDELAKMVKRVLISRLKKGGVHVVVAKLLEDHSVLDWSNVGGLFASMLIVRNEFCHNRDDLTKQPNVAFLGAI